VRKQRVHRSSSRKSRGITETLVEKQSDHREARMRKQWAHGKARVRKQRNHREP